MYRPYKMFRAGAIGPGRLNAALPLYKRRRQSAQNEPVNRFLCIYTVHVGPMSAASLIYIG